MTPRVRKTDSPFAEVPGCSYLELHQASGIYYVRTSVQGKGELFKSTRSRKKGEAKTIADLLIEEFSSRKRGLKNKRVKISQMCDELLIQCEEETRLKDEDGLVLRRAVTFQKDKVYIPQVKTHFGDEFADTVDEIFVKGWIKRKGRKLGIKLGDLLKYLSKTLTYAFEEAYIGRKPRIKNPDKAPKKAANYSDALTMIFVRSADPTLKAMTVIGAENPLRPNEIDSMQWAFLSFTIDQATGEEITLYRLPDWFEKRGEARELILSANSNRILRKRQEDRNKVSPYVFPAVKDPSRPMSRQHRAKLWGRMKERAKKLAKREGVEYPIGPIKFHWLRHNFYRKALIEQGLPLAAVSMAGGTSMKTLQTSYLDSVAGQTRQVTQAVTLNLTGEGEEE